MKAFVFVLLTVFIAFPFERLSKKQIKEFNDSYAMLKKGYEKGKYTEVNIYGKKTIEDFKIIPLDDRKDIVEQLAPKYAEIIYLLAKANLHLTLNGKADTLIACRRALDYDCMTRLADIISGTIEQSGILAKDDPEKAYFQKYRDDAVTIKDSIPALARYEYRRALDDKEKKRVGEKVAKYAPDVLEEMDSIRKVNAEEAYYRLLNSDDAAAIDSFIKANPRYEAERIKNLSEHKDAVISDVYLLAKKTGQVELVEDFLIKYPGSKYETELKAWLEWLYMKKALRSSGIYESRQYIEKFPQGKYSKEVMEHFDKLTRGEADTPQVPAYK